MRTEQFDDDMSLLQEYTSIMRTYLMIALMGTILSVLPSPARFDLLTPMDKFSSVSLVRTKRLLVPLRARCREKQT